MASHPATLPAALAGIVVLEIGGTRTHYCGKLLAELGADVLLVEPPGGVPSRHMPPFTDDDATISLGFQYLNTSKRSIVIDLDDGADRDLLDDLARRAHLVLNPHVPGVLERHGVSLRRMRERNPALVTVSITPFGETGPLANCEAPDLVCMALGGLMSLGGYSDDSPMALPYDQASVAAGAFAAVAALIALRHSESTGQGQHVDTSVQQCVTLALENAVQFYQLEGTIRRRTGGHQRVAGTGTFPTTDGYVFILAAGIGGNRFWPNLVRWLREEGAAGVERLEGENFTDREVLESSEAKAAFADVFGAFTAKRSKQEIYEQSQAYRVPCAPVNDATSLLANPQLTGRGFFGDVEITPGRSAKAPGPPYQLSLTPWRGTGRAPELNEDEAWVRELVLALGPKEEP